MISSKLIQVLSFFNKNDWNLLKNFVHSPTHNQHEGVKRLFSYLDTHYGHWTQEILNIEKVYPAVFDDTTIHPAKLRHITSYFIQVIERFLAYQEWRKDDFDINIATVKAYKRQNNIKQAFYKLGKVKKQTQKHPFKNGLFFQHQYEIELENYHLAEQKTRKSTLNLNHLSNQLDTAFIIEKLKWSCTQLTHQAVYEVNYDTEFLNLILKFLSNSNYLSIPAVAIYYHSYLALKYPNMPEHFTTLKQLMKANSPLFPQNELKNIYLLIINYCIRQINTGNPRFEKELFDFYKNGLEQEVFIENSILSRWTYKNIVSIGLGLKEFEWIDFFIHQYKRFIDKPYRENTFNYNLAKLHYQKGSYNEAMQLLLHTTEKDLLLLLDAKRLMCKIYYETAEWKALDSYLHSFELYIRRQQGISYHKENYLNFIKCLKKLLHLNFYEKGAVENLQAIIKSYKVLPEKRWLIKQLLR